MFKKCKDGVALYRDESVRSRISEWRPEPSLPPLSPKTKTKAISALSETISSMAKLRMDDQRCSLNKVRISLNCLFFYFLKTNPHRKEYKEELKFLPKEKVALNCWI